MNLEKSVEKYNNGLYNINEEFTDFKFVFLVSFEDIKIASLKNLAKIVSKRQLIGASKFYS